MALRLSHDGALTVRFGGSEAAYERLDPTAADAAAFAEVAVGNYFSADGDASARITAQGDTLSIHTCDGHGELTARLVPLSSRVAYAKPGGPLAPFRYTITLEAAGETAGGFTLSTTRTRNLAFRRA